MVNSFTPITTLRYWCQKVIPLVYEDSLSYYELLSKVINKLNEVIVNNNLLPDLIVDQIKEMLDTDLIEEIVQEFLEETTGLVFDDDLTSNDIDIENLYNYVNQDYRVTGETGYDCIQDICVMPDNSFVAISQDERNLVSSATKTNSGLIRHINSNGSISNEYAREIGHGNSVCTDGNYVYVVWGYEYNGTVETQTNKISIFEYPNFNLIKTVNLDILPLGIAYEYDHDRLIVLGRDEKIYIYDKELDVVIMKISPNRPDYKSSQKVLQNVFYYKDMIGIVTNFPNLLEFYSFDGELKKIYNMPDKINYGTPFTEVEGCVYHNGDFYLTSYARLEHGTYGYSNIAKMNPFKNTFNTFIKKARYSGVVDVYVDGEGGNGFMNGTAQYPFNKIGLALSMSHSMSGLYSMIRIRCKGNVGEINHYDLKNVIITNWEDTQDGTRYNIEGVHLRMSKVLFRWGNIISNPIQGFPATTTCVYIEDSEINFYEMAIDGGNRNICVFTTRSNVKFTSPTFSNASVGIQSTQSSEISYTSATFNNVTNRYAMYSNSRITTPERIRIKATTGIVAVPNNVLIEPMTTVNFRTGEYDLTGTNITDYVQNGSVVGVNNALIGVSWDGQEQQHLIRINASGNSTFFISGFKYRGTELDIPFLYEVYGSINLSTKKLVIDDIVLYRISDARKYSYANGDGGVTYPILSVLQLM